MITCVIIGAGGRGKDAYAPYIKKTGIMKIVGVAEPNKAKREEFKKDYDIPDENCFETYQNLFAKGKIADACFICTQDRMHLEPLFMAMKQGYHIMLEKPISTSVEELNEIEAATKGYDKVFITAFVLRYTPFLKKIKEVIDSGIIGSVITIQHNENEGFWHHSHSYVRGEWSKSSESSPVIVAKSCHDLDLILYLVNSKCTSVSSYGSNTFFVPDNALGEVPLRCTDGCPFAEGCVYNAVKLYTQGPGKYFVHKFNCGNTDKEIIDALKSNPFGRCIYKCDNDVCDHQVVNLQFENGATAVFTLSAFSMENTRTLKVMGTKGEIGGCMEKGIISLKTFSDLKEQVFNIETDGTKHSGGDSGLIEHFVSLINSEKNYRDEKMFESHKIAFAAEQSRVTGKIVDLH
jgi:predicted dehydrogenase